MALVEATTSEGPVFRGWSRVLRNSLKIGETRVGLSLVLFVLLIAVVGPLVAPHSPSASVARPYETASSAFPFGTDALGRDVLSRILWGGLSVFGLSVSATTLAVVAGVIVGLIAGYSRSRFDDVITAFMDLILAFPQIVLVLLFVSMLGPRLWLIVLIVALSHLPNIVRLVRAQTLDLVHREFVEAAEALGLPRRRIVLGEILPNLTSPLMVEVGLRLTWSIAIISGLSFLGFGIQPPNADWGLMINENRLALVIQPWPVLAPVLLIAVLTIGVNLATEGFAVAAAGIRPTRTTK
jgi:peptide/nickel transport system permease protein